MLKKLLNKYGVEVTVAAEGRTAVELVLQEIDKYHLIFMDNLMPLMVRIYIG